jgi:ABC-type polysaccharide/polyol phosphate transport system ATPase subunit
MGNFTFAELGSYADTNVKTYIKEMECERMV